MTSLRIVLSRVLGTLGGRRHDRDLSDEIQMHLDRLADEHIRAGMSLREAQFAARRDFGGVDQTKEAYRDQRGLPLVEMVAHELRFAFRRLSRNPGFTLAAVLTLALGIGANTAIFSLVDAILMKPMPYPDPNRIVRISGSAPADIQRFTMFTPAGFQIWPSAIQESRMFKGIGLYATGGLNLGADTPERLRAAAVTAGFFDALGAAPLMGRAFRAEEVRQNERVALISHRLWQRRFDARPAIVGQAILLNGRPFIVVGVMPPRADFPDLSDVWVPAGSVGTLGPGLVKPVLIARLAPGVTPTQAANDVSRIEGVSFKGQADPSSLNTLLTIHITSIRSAIVEDVRPFLLLVASGALLVLLVTTINTAIVLMARVSARQRDLAVRRSIGASNWDLVRQLLCESVLLSGGAGIMAVPAAAWTIGAIRGFVPATLYGAPDIGIDARAIGATAVFSLLATVVFAWAPSMVLQGAAARDVLRGPSVATFAPFWSRFRRGLVVAEIAVTLVLLAGGVAVVRKVAELMAVDLGARGDRALVSDLTLPRATYDSGERVQQFYERVEADLRNTAGLREVGAASGLLGDDPVETSELLVDGEPTPTGGKYVGRRLMATPRYFAALGIDLMAGRIFTDRDGKGAPRVAIVSEQYAANFGMRPAELVGHTGILNHRRVEIVGVVRDVRLGGPESAFEPAAYVPFAQEPTWDMHLVVKGETDPRRFVPAIRAAIAGADPNVPLHTIRTFDEIRASYLTERRFVMTMMLVFGGLACGVSVLGLYSVISYLVQLRTQEIGIRMALGASSSLVLRQVLGSGVSLALTGTLIGALFALALSRLIADRMPGLGHVDLASLALLASAIVTVATAAAWLPARRATLVDPAHTLRFE